MALPKQTEIEIPLLEVLIEMGGNGKAKDIYPLVTKKFPSITDEDLQIKLASGGNKWTNSIQWARQRLISKGEISTPNWGVWEITDKGLKRLEKKGKIKIEDIEDIEEILSTQIKNLSEIFEDYDEKFRSQLLEKLYELTPKQFENFAKRLLIAYGFVNVNVTSITKDGGIDGYGKLKLGLAHMNVAFQCKRWEGNIGRVEIDKFRGAIQGEFEQGIFFTTSDFVKGATEISLKKGAVPIILINGQAIVDLMIQKSFGVDKKPIYLYEIDEKVFFEEE